MPESPKHDVSIWFYVIALIALLYLIYNLRRLFTIQAGKNEPNNTNFNFFYKVYHTLTLGIGQKRVYSKRFTFASIMHFLIGWGFIELVFATTVDFFKARGWFYEYLPEFDTPWFAFINDTGGLMLTIGLIMALYRRKINTPKPLPNEDFTSRGNLFGDSGILLFLLLLCVGGFLSEAARLGEALGQNTLTEEQASYSYVGYFMYKTSSSSGFSW